VYVVGENGDLVEMNLAAARRFAEYGTDNLGVHETNGTLPQSRVPRDVYV
jgi:hypothetical protein